MKKWVTPLSVGLFTTLTLGALMWGILRVKKGMPAGATAQTVTAMFPDAAGLGPRTRVMMAGVGIGQIDSITLQEGKAKLVLTVRQDAGLKVDAEIAKRQASVLGDYFLELFPGAAKELLPEGGEIKKVRMPAGIPELIQRLAGVTGTVDLVAKDVRQVTQRIAGIFGSEEGAGKMRQILDNVAGVASRINGSIAMMTGKISRILDNFGQFSVRLRGFTGDTASQVRNILGKVDGIAQSIRAILERSGDSLKGNFGQVKDALEGAKKAVDSVNRSLASVEAVTSRVRDGEGLVGAITSKKSDGIVVKTEKILDQGEKVVGKVGDVVDEVGESVKGIGDFLDPLIRLQPIVDIRSEVSMLSGKFKTYVALQLQTTLDKFLFIELVNDPRGRTTFSKSVTRSTSSRRG